MSHIVPPRRDQMHNADGTPSLRYTKWIEESSEQTNIGTDQTTINTAGIATNASDITSLTVLISDNSTDIAELGTMSAQDADSVAITGGTAKISLLQLSGGTGTQGEMTWNTDEETVDLIHNGATLQLGQEMHIHCRNNSGATLGNGVPVMATGTLGASGRITIGKMNSSLPANAKYFLGITTESINNGEDGKVTTFGKVRSLDTTGTPYSETWVEGDVVWADPANIGGFTNVQPATGSLALAIAIVINIHATNGVLFVRATNLDENKLSNPLTTKGDIFTYSTTDARLAVGTNDQVLTADSAEATGMKWATPAAGGGDNNVDGGTATSVYISTQLIDGGSA